MPYERKNSPVLSRRLFYSRLWRNFLISAILIGISLAIGVFGYHWICDLSWVDALLNASMILTGMGPVSPMMTDAAKIFSSAYALFSGIAFLSTVAVLIAPVAHRFLHRFHAEED